MNGLNQTKFADTDDPIKMTRQLADAVNRIERILQILPLYFGENNPNGFINAFAGSLYLRYTQQGLAYDTAKVHVYIKKTDNGNEDWAELIILGNEPQTDVTAYRGALYFLVPETNTTASLFFKQTEDASKNGWVAL